MDNLFRIQVEFLGKKYPLHILREDEGIIREAAKLLEKRYSLYAEGYDMQLLEEIGQEILPLVAFDLACRSVCISENSNLIPFVKKIEELDNEIAEYLNADKEL